MIKKIISVIIPVHNVEKYLRVCLNSVLNQTINNYEVIIVNDASTDSSTQIVREFAEKYEQFKLIDLKENIGVARSRKLAIEAAKGEYLAFLDSDDSFEPNYLEKMYSTMIKNDADLVYCNYRLVNSQTYKKIDVRIRKPFAGVTTGRKLAKLIVADFRGRSYLWNKLWKKSLFLQKDLTLPNMCYEDLAIVSLITHGAKKVVVINDILINYTVNRATSIVASMTEEKVNDYHSTLYIIRDFMEKQSDFTYYKYAFFRLCMAMFFSIPYNVGRVEVSFRDKLKLTQKSLKDIFTAMSSEYIEHRNKTMPKLLVAENKFNFKADINTSDIKLINNVTNIKNTDKTHSKRKKSKKSTKFEELAV